MKNLRKIQEKIRILENEKRMIQENYEKELRKRNLEIKNLYEKKCNLYPEYFESKRNLDFVLYQKFPSKLVVSAYDGEYDREHPLYDYGYFEVKELVMLIRYLYSFWKQKEYRVITFGFLNVGKFFEPEICFLIGDDKRINSYFAFKDCFLENKKVLDWDLRTIMPNRMAVMASSSINSYHELGIWLDSEIHFYDESGFYYYHPMKEKYACHCFSNYKNIFNDCINWKNYEGIKDTLSFSMHLQDSFIAKVLISIVIYKKNHRKIDLSNEDYQHIFYQLFGEDSIDIKNSVEKEIPKILKYTSFQK